MGVTGVDLYSSSDGGASFPTAIAVGLPNTGSYSWEEPGLVGTAYRVKLIAHDAAGLQAVAASDSNFTLQPANPPTATVLSPDGGETFGLGATVPVTWTMEDTCVGIDSTRVLVSLNGGSDWIHVVTVPAPDTTASWTASAVTDSARVRVEVFDEAGLVGVDASDGLFSVADDTPPTVEVLSPNGGESFPAGSTVNIDASVSDNAGVDSVCVSYSLNDGSTWNLIACGALSFPYPWTTPSTPSDSCRVRVQAWDLGGNSSFDVSDSTFTLESSTAAGPAGPSAVREVMLFQNHPNPMGSSSTVLSFALPQDTRVRLSLYDLSGREVRVLEEGRVPVGTHQTRWDGTDDNGRRVSPGVYFYRVDAQQESVARKLVVLP